jgi:hypothetical protein
MSHIQITQEGMRSTVSVDGTPLERCVTEANVKLEAGSLPVVEVRLIAFDAGLDLKDGVLKVGALDAPEALERALLEHLKAKYESILDYLRQPVLLGVDMAAGVVLTSGALVGAGGVVDSEEVPAGTDPMEAIRALCERQG